MKKHILIIIPSFGIGGISVSLQSMLAAIDPNQYTIEVFACARKGGFINNMPNCTILPENIWLSTEIVEGNIFKRLAKKCLWILCRSLYRLGIDIYPLIGRMGGRKMDTLKYDTVVGFSETLAKYISDIPSKHRVLWIHCDYKRYLSISNIKEEKKIFSKIDKIVAVSEHVEKQLKELYPDMVDNFLHIHNVININHIRNMASKDIELDSEFDTSEFTIVSAGRLDPVKQFDRIPEIAQTICNMTTPKFKWYIIGGGDTSVADVIDNEIEQRKVSHCVKRLSAKSNIYPYMAKANLYVCTSSSESFPLVVNEAKALCVPVVSTDFPSVRESIVEGRDGFVVKLEQMATTIARLIETPMHISECTIDNEHKLEAIYNIL